MESFTGDNIIGLALEDLGVIRPGELPSATVMGNCLARLNQMLGSLSTEQLIAQTQVNGQYILTVGLDRYTFGVGGNFSTAARPQRLTAWQATYGSFNSGGAPMSWTDFDAASSATQAQIATILAPFRQSNAGLLAGVQVPLMLAADVSSPLIHVGVYPRPTTAASIELTYWTALSTFLTGSSVVSMPDGWADFLHSNLAMELLPRYGRQGFDAAALAALAASTKARIVALNTFPAPQQSQQGAA